jgi:hypothetical protein
VLRGGGRYEGDWRDGKKTGRDIFTWVGVLAGAWQQQAAGDDEPACGRGGCDRRKGVRACERAQRVGACVMAGRGSRACAADGRGQVVLTRGWGCVRHASVLRRGGD